MHPLPYSHEDTGSVGTGLLLGLGAKTTGLGKYTPSLPTLVNVLILVANNIQLQPVTVDDWPSTRVDNPRNSIPSFGNPHITV